MLLKRMPLAVEMMPDGETVRHSIPLANRASPAWPPAAAPPAKPEQGAEQRTTSSQLIRRREGIHHRSPASGIFLPQHHHASISVRTNRHRRQEHQASINDLHTWNTGVYPADSPAKVRMSTHSWAAHQLNLKRALLRPTGKPGNEGKAAWRAEGDKAADQQRGSPMLNSDDARW